MKESPWKIRAFLAFQKGKVRQDRTSGGAHPGLLLEPDALAHAGNVDERQETGQLGPAIDQRDLDRAQPGRGSAGARNGKPTETGGALAGGGAA